MLEIVVWVVAGLVGIGSLVVIFWPLPRYESVTRKRPKKP